MLRTGRLYLDFTIFIISFCGFVYSNKYVLSRLHFKYPTIFQGWQTLFGLAFIRLVACCRPKHAPCGLDKPGFVTLLPNFLFFTGSLVASSKALADIPVPIFLAVQNLMPALVYLLDYSPRFRSASSVSLGGAALLLATSVVIVVLDLDMTFKDSPYFWLFTHVLCATVHTIHGSVADARYSDMDRLYYSYLVGVVTLAPASLYLEEAFLALRFPYKSQADFVIGCLFSGMFGVLLSIFSIHVQDSCHAAAAHGLARILSSLGSVWLFSDHLPGPLVSGLVVANLLCSMVVGWLPRPDSIIAPVSRHSIDIWRTNRQTLAAAIDNESAEKLLQEDESNV